jgi:hypothetical protein
VEFIPDVLEDSILYISLKYGTVIHRCPCGCGNEVNTSLHPTGWKMIYDGESVSLKPSIGNWSFDCKSHYWITNNDVEWSLKWSEEKIHNIRKFENYERQEYYENKDSENLEDDSGSLKEVQVSKPKKTSWFQKLIFWK